jgi:hypothetical protein
MLNANRPTILSTPIITAAKTLIFTAALALLPHADAQDANAPAKKPAAKKSAAKPDAEPAKAAESSPPAAPAEKPAEEDVARWLGGIEPKGDALKKLAESASWKTHAKGLEAAWDQSEKRRIGRVRTWAPDALGEINKADSPVFYFFSGADFLYPHALYPNAKTYVLCAIEPVGSQPNPLRIPAGEVGSSLSVFRRSLDALLGFSFFRTIDLRKDVVQRHIPGILPVLEMILARVGADVTEVALVRCDENGALSGEADAKGSPGARIKFHVGDKPEQTLYYFSGDLSNDGLKKHGGILKFGETLGTGRSLLKAASYLPHEAYFTKINEWILAHSSVIVQDPSGIPMRGFPKDGWTFKFWGRNPTPIGLFKNKYEPALASAIKAAPSLPLPFGFGYQHEPASSLLILAEKK